MNVQMAPSLQSEHRLILQRIPEPAANGQSQRKPEEIYVVPTELERKEKSYKEYRLLSMLYKHFSEKRLEVDVCPFFILLRFDAVTRGQKRSKNMHFLPHVGEPLFHCVQGRRFVGVRGSYDCRVAFLKGAFEI